MSGEVSKEVLKPKIGDAAPELFTTVLSTICLPAGFIAGLMQIYLGTPASRRAEAFILSIDERLTELEQKGVLNKETLLQEPKFNTIVMQATQIAIRTHQEEKLKALKNAVLNCALTTNIEEDLQLMYLNTIDSLTASHIKLLMFFNIPHEYVDQPGDNFQTMINNIIEQFSPEFRGKYVYYQQLIKDLVTKGLLNSGIGINYENPTEKYYPEIISNLGADLVDFISSRI